MVVFDTTTLLLARDPNSRPPRDPATNLPVTRCAERVTFLLKGLSERGERVLTPTPVIAEFLVKAGKNKAKFANEFVASRNFVIGDFDMLAAIELSTIKDPDLDNGKSLDPIVTKAKIKFDRQILAIAKVHQAHTMYTDDGRLRDVAVANGLRVVMTWDLDVPPEPPQASLGLEEPPQPHIPR
jgi:predicted nucleic acid-binding protein